MHRRVRPPLVVDLWTKPLQSLFSFAVNPAPREFRAQLLKGGDGFLGLARSRQVVGLLEALVSDR